MRPYRKFLQNVLSRSVFKKVAKSGSARCRLSIEKPVESVKYSGALPSLRRPPSKSLPSSLPSLSRRRRLLSWGVFESECPNSLLPTAGHGILHQLKFETLNRPWPAWYRIDTFNLLKIDKLVTDHWPFKLQY